MAKITMYLNRDVAQLCGCNIETVECFARKPENNINRAGLGKQKIYIWFDEDIARFKNRPPPGRPRAKSK